MPWGSAGLYPQRKRKQVRFTGRGGGEGFAGVGAGGEYLG